MPGAKPRFFRTPEAFGKWLEANHAKRPELVVGFWKVHTGKPSMTWPQSVEQALRFGWIDGVRRSVDGDAYCIRFTPRKAGSHWSNVNVRTAQALVDGGRMAPAGLAAFRARTTARTGQASYEQPPARFPSGLAKAFRADAKAWAAFLARPPWYRRTATRWVVTAKRPQTRARRLAKLVEACRAGLVLDWAARPVAPPAKRPRKPRESA